MINRLRGAALIAVAALAAAFTCTGTAHADAPHAVSYGVTGSDQWL